MPRSFRFGQVALAAHIWPADVHATIVHLSLLILSLLSHPITLFQLAKQDEYETRRHFVQLGNKTGICVPILSFLVCRLLNIPKHGSKALTIFLLVLRRDQRESGKIGLLSTAYGVCGSELYGRSGSGIGQPCINLTKWESPSNQW